MSQGGVLAVLEEHKGRWFSTKQISELLGLNYQSVVNNVKRLKRYGAVKSKFVRGHSFSGHFEYKHKEG